MNDHDLRDLERIAVCWQILAIMAPIVGIIGFAVLLSMMLYTLF